MSRRNFWLIERFCDRKQVGGRYGSERTARKALDAYCRERGESMRLWYVVTGPFQIKNSR